MKFIETKVEGVWIIECDFFPDERGSFAVAWMADELRTRGLSSDVSQCTLAFNYHRGTIRGMHYQAVPMGQAKTVRAIRGAIWDVVVDLREDSPTFKEWVGTQLTAENRQSLHIPIGCAHGYQTLTDNSELMYLISGRYSPFHERGVRWNDPAFGIEWPLEAPALIHPRDASYPDFVSSPPN